MSTPPSATNIGHAEAMKWFEARRASYEKLVASISPHVGADDTIFDVGANIGYFTQTLRRLACFEGRAHLFEPLPHLQSLCRQTFEGDGSDTHIHDFGLSDSDGAAELFVAADGNLGWNTIVAEKASAGMQPVTIQLRAFETCGVEDQPSFIKIDVEGAEYRVLRGMIRALRRWTPKPVILCEVGWGKDAHPAWAEELAMFGQLERLGYGVTDLAGQPMDVATIARTTDVLFVPG